MRRKQVRSLRSFGVLSLALVLLFGLLLSATGFAAARPAIVPGAQATTAATATVIDPEAEVKLEMGKAVTTPLDQDAVPHRYFTFKGQANKMAVVTVQKLKGNLSFKLSVTSQGSQEVGYAGGQFIETSTLIVKLPMDGNYSISVSADKPGAGDFEAGEVSVVVNDAPTK